MLIDQVPSGQSTIPKTIEQPQRNVQPTTSLQDALENFLASASSFEQE
jgi:hypothetical protein